MKTASGSRLYKLFSGRLGMSKLTKQFAIAALLGGFVITCTSFLFGAYSRQITFSGYVWSVKTSRGRVGPGPNYFSDSTQSVWVDTLGRLHMKIRKTKGKWHCSEIVSMNNFGYGTYRFYIDTPVDNLNPYVVLGLFTWSDNPAYNNREIDIEFSRWGSVNNQNAQYVVQPYTLQQNIHRFQWPAAISLSMHSFDWRNGQVACRSQHGQTVPPAASDILQQKTFTSGIPVPGDENARINLWLSRGHAPSDGREVELVFSKFEFVP